ncbi:hypothetical protein BHM03_00044048 [Ensete ventricosum]|nr:hypothetical protein BHM03_00044048 [Ensete ventricosum]
MPSTTTASSSLIATSSPPAASRRTHLVVASVIVASHVATGCAFCFATTATADHPSRNSRLLPLLLAHSFFHCPRDLMVLNSKFGASVLAFAVQRQLLLHQFYCAYPVLHQLLSQAYIAAKVNRRQTFTMVDNIAIEDDMAGLHSTQLRMRIRYDLGRELGRGEFGITYLCTDKDSGELFACKSISKKKLRTIVDIEDVRREVEIMRHLPSHPNIVSLRDTYEDDDAVHLVMELCEGGELFDRIVARGHYTERAAAMIIRTIVQVVQIKSHNFFIYSLSLMLIHFGTAFLQVVAEHLSVEEVADIKDMFEKIDVNSKGQITLEELKHGLHKLEYPISDADLKILMDAVSFFLNIYCAEIILQKQILLWCPSADADGNGSLNYREFVAVSIHIRKIGNDEHLHKAFRYFDRNNTGYIEIEELSDCLADELGPNHEEVINAIIRDVDTDKVSFILIC